LQEDSGVARRNEGKDASLADEKPQATACKAIPNTEEKLESEEDDGTVPDDSLAGLESYSTYYTWDDDPRKMHMHIDEQSQFESKYQWVLEKMFCGLIDSMHHNDGSEIGRGRAVRASALQNILPLFSTKTTCRSRHRPRASPA
jgi:hypothetical protein